MSGIYASETQVPAEKSRGEIERTLARYGASTFGYGWNENGAVVTFEAHGRRIQFTIPLPLRDDPAFTHYKRGSTRFRREPAQAEKLWEQAGRQRWRALALAVKAKLEMVAAGISTFEDEFLPYTLVPGPNGHPVPVATLLQPQVDEAYRTGVMPGGLMLALPRGGDDGGDVDADD